MVNRLCSKDVAELMEKRHDNLMRTIRTDLKNLENPEKYYRADAVTDALSWLCLIDCFDIWNWIWNDISKW